MKLYEEADYKKTKKTLWMRAALCAAVLAVFAVLVGLFVSVWRNSLLTMAVCAVGGVVLMYCLTTKFMPWFRYWHYLVDIKNGRTHEMDCSFVSVSDGERMSDGVAFHEFIVSLDNEEEKDNERLLFWDADKTLPDLRVGQKMHICSFGSYIIELSAE